MLVSMDVFTTKKFEGEDIQRTFECTFMCARKGPWKMRKLEPKNPPETSKNKMCNIVNKEYSTCFLGKLV